MKGKQSLTNKFLCFFCRKLYFFKSATIKVACPKGLGRDLKIIFFLAFDYLKIV